MPAVDTRETILSTARLMVQAHGYNALSFRELAKEVGIKSASIHYHFPTKGDLAAALACRYTDDAQAYFDELLVTSLDASACIGSYADVFRTALLRDNRMCLCGIMAAERDDLPAEVLVQVDRFTDVNVRWLSAVLARDAADQRHETHRERALAIFAAMEGAQLVARGRGDIRVFDQIVAVYRAAGLLP